MCTALVIVAIEFGILSVLEKLLNNNNNNNIELMNR